MDNEAESKKLSGKQTNKQTRDEKWNSRENGKTVLLRDGWECNMKWIKRQLQYFRLKFCYLDFLGDMVKISPSVPFRIKVHSFKHSTPKISDFYNL